MKYHCRSVFLIHKISCAFVRVCSGGGSSGGSGGAGAGSFSRIARFKSALGTAAFALGNITRRHALPCIVHARAHGAGQAIHLCRAHSLVEARHLNVIITTLQARRGTRATGHFSGTGLQSTEVCGLHRRDSKEKRQKAKGGHDGFGLLFSLLLLLLLEMRDFVRRTGRVALEGDRILDETKKAQKTFSETASEESSDPEWSWG